MARLNEWFKSWFESDHKYGFYISRRPSFKGLSLVNVEYQEPIFSILVPVFSLATNPEHIVPPDFHAPWTFRSKYVCRDYEICDGWGIPF